VADIAAIRTIVMPSACGADLLFPMMIARLLSLKNNP
jgi:hypothetical protein